MVVKKVMESVDISYRIKLSEDLVEVFDYELDGSTFEIISAVEIAEPPKWTELGFRQCSHCPLDANEHKHCPVALQLHDIVQRFHETRSIDEIELVVVTEQRTVTKVTALQNAISSLLGLVFPISGCPKTAGMKPLARFHVPMASEEETVFNVSGMFLLAQYFLNNKSKSGVFSFDGLISIYEDLHILNKAVASRLQAVTSSDSVKNAITLLDMYSSLVPMLLQDQLVEIRGFFGAYLPEGEEQLPKSNYLEQAKAFKLELIPTDEEMREKEIAAQKLAAEKAAAEENQRLHSEKSEVEKRLEEEEKKLPEWLRRSLSKEKPPLPPITFDASAKAEPQVVEKPAPVKAVPIEPKKDYPSSILSLELEPIAEAVNDEDEKIEEGNIKPKFLAVEKPKITIVKKEDEQEEKKDEDDGGLKMIDFE
jgi:hypothetical protein